MSRSYMCDVCGVCVSHSDQALSEREMLRGNMTINGTEVDTGLILKAYVPNVCDTCWDALVARVRQYIINNT